MRPGTSERYTDTLLPSQLDGSVWIQTLEGFECRCHEVRQKSASDAPIVSENESGYEGAEAWGGQKNKIVTK